MRYFLLLFCFFLFFSSCHRGNVNAEQTYLYTPAFTAEVVAQFTPLNANERFAYTLQPIRLDPVGAQFNMTLYAVRDNDIEDRRELFLWENVDDTHGVQFTSDFRTVFFTEREAIPPTAFKPLYKANGVTGEVKRLPMGVMLPWRASKDGRFIAFINWWQQTDFLNREQANIFVYEVETGEMTQLLWRVNMPLEGGWILSRYENIFLIRGGMDQGGVAAIAELNPATMELKTLVDVTDWYNQIGTAAGIVYLFPNLLFRGDVLVDLQAITTADTVALWEINIVDDVSFQSINPNVRLQGR